MLHVFIIGSKGIPAQYGGFETFVEKLTLYRKDREIQYHVSCIGNKKETFWHNGARCFRIRIPDIGPAKAVYYDISAFIQCKRYIKKNKIELPVIYILACRIGPFFYLLKKMPDFAGRIYVNPDGHEWMRGKWNRLIRRYWKISERLMVKNADLIICDSECIRNYIKREYAKYGKPTVFIPYGAKTDKSVLEDNSTQWTNWKKKFHVHAREYYLIVGRFVPENNYLTMLKEFCKSRTQKDLVIITRPDNTGLMNKIEAQVDIHGNPRIKFVGTVYDQELLKKIRENAYAYLHGHEVGGTNPSLLEALASTPVNLLLDVGFNREVGGEGALYFSKAEGDLSNAIDQVERMTEEERKVLEREAKTRIRQLYNWDGVVAEYERIFKSRV